ncbi:hypothetical protein [Nonomuraea longicatena]|uniref:Leucine-rich repeat domain-containing protein n=1 Tax=Nonomuraea longicatena TaxID=83682 RepID=A0ABN1P9N6_9ACTN
MIPNLPALRALLPTATPTRAWRAVRELAIVAPHVTRPALELAGEFAEIALPPTKRLLKIWQKTPDPDGFAEFIVAPAFVREGRTELPVKGSSLPVGLRHLTNLRRVELSRSADYIDVSELSGLTELTALSLRGAVRITDFSPLAELTRLENLDLGDTRISDLSPLLGLRRLARLNLSRTKVASLEGFVDAFPHLTELDVTSCDAIDDVRPLSGASNLRSLDVSWTSVTDLTGLRDLPALEELTVGEKLVSLDGLDALPSLRKLAFGPGSDLKHLAPGGPHPQVTELDLRFTSLPDLSIVSRFPSVTEISLSASNHVTSLEPLRGHPSLAKVQLTLTTRLKDLSPLGDLPALRELELFNVRRRDLSQLAGLPPLAKLEISGSNQLIRLNGIPEVRSLHLDGCPALSDLTALGEWVEELTITMYSSVRELRQITRLRGLKRLRMDGGHPIRINSLADLRGLDALTELTIGAHEPISLNGLERLPALRELDFPGKNPVTDLDKVGHPHLKKLDLAYRPLPGLGWLSAFPALTEILISPESGITSLDELAGNPSITTVGLFGPQVKDLSVLATLPALRELRIGDVDDFDTWVLPAALPGVEKLSILSVPGTRTLDGLPKMPDLRYAHISYCPKLSDLGPLRDVPAEISDCPKLA